MTNHTPLLQEIDRFIAATGMGESYFGKKAIGNSELVSRLRQGKSVLVKTDEAVRRFIRENGPSSDAPLSGAGAEGSCLSHKPAGPDSGLQGMENHTGGGE